MKIGDDSMTMEACTGILVAVISVRVSVVSTVSAVFGAAISVVSTVSGIVVEVEKGISGDMRAAVAVRMGEKGLSEGVGSTTTDPVGVMPAEVGRLLTVVNTARRIEQCIRRSSIHVSIYLLRCHSLFPSILLDTGTPPGPHRILPPQLQQYTVHGQ